MSNEYDISKAFQEIEETLIKSMKTNLTRHLKEEKYLDMNWSAWQMEQLKTLEQFKRNNKKLFKDDFFSINSNIENLIKRWNEEGKSKQEIIILENIKNGKFKSSDKEINKLWSIYNRTKNNRIKKKQLKRIHEKINLTEAEFFKLNDIKLSSLIKETTNNIKKLETSILRYTNDQYRKIIYNAQIYANTGAGTIKQAIDMATKDFLEKGINSIEYANGMKVNIASYAEMAIRTANKRAYLQGEGEKRKQWGVHTVLVPNRSGGCPYCIKFQGKIFIDDVWSGGTEEESKVTGYQLLSEAIKKKLFHPNCEDTVVTYFPGITALPIPPTEEELERKKKNYIIKQKQRYNERQIRKYKRLELGSTNKDNIEKYHKKRIEWQQYNKEFCKKHNLKRKYDRENVKGIIDIEKTSKDDIILKYNEQQAINQFISSESYKINDKLRNNFELSNKDKNLINNLDTVLKKCKNYEGNVVRVLNIRDEQLLQEFLERNEIERIEEWKEYLSFSNKSGYNEEANIKIYVQSTKGKDIRKYNKEESEILYNRNSKFITKNKTKIDNTYYILWEEVNE